MNEETLDSTEKLAEHVAMLVRDAKDHNEAQQKHRRLALQYAQGEMPDLKSEPNRSSVVSMDIRAAFKKLKPSIMRTILGGGDTVTYSPVGPEDEAYAQQATDYVNHVIIPEGNVEKAIEDAVTDALYLKTGILKWTAYRRTKVTVQEYTEQPDQAIVGLFDDPNVTISDYEASEETDPQVLAIDPNARRHSFTMKRVEDKVTPTIVAVPRGNFLITPDANSIEEADLVGEECILGRSTLVQMGYDKGEVWQLARWDAPEEDEEELKGDDFTDKKRELRKANEDVLVYDVYVRLDLDEDGIAELYHVVYGDGKGGKDGKGSLVVLEIKEADEAPYTEVVAERDAHQFEGHSLYEDLREVQRVKTALLRQVLDNAYASNMPRPVVDVDAVDDPQAVVDMAFGKPIVIKPGRNAATAVQWQSVPFFADKAFGVMEYFDGIAKDRTGVTDASGGLTPDQVNNTSATAAQILTESGVATADSIVKSVAKGIRRAFKGLLRLVVAHADAPRTVQMKGEWVQFDPRVWNVDMGCTVNIGLGSGTKERDMMILQQIYAAQKDLLANLGPDIGQLFVKSDQLYNTLAKFVEAAGMPSADPFFSMPEQGAVDQAMQARSQQPNPEVIKVQAQMQVEQAKLQAQKEIKAVDVQVQRDKEASQMQADLAVKQAEMEKDTFARQEERAAQAMLKAQELAFQREKLAADLAQRQAEMAQQREIEMMRLGARDGENGPVMKEDDRMNATIEALGRMMAEFAQNTSKPKRVIRDENGDVIGVETIN